MSALSLGAAGEGRQVRPGLVLEEAPGKLDLKSQKEGVWCKPDFLECLLSQGLLLGSVGLPDSSEVCVVG